MIIVVFKGCPPLQIDVDQTAVTRDWLSLIAQHLKSNQAPIFRDPQKYTQAKLRGLADEASRRLGWAWDVDDLSLSNTTRMHKDIEVYLARGYENIPEEFDELLHEIHFCLHSVESGSQRNHWLQIEWFTDDCVPLPADHYPAKLHLEFGDIRLQNPYVGHHPLYLWQQDDHANVMQTCRFHDKITPGVCIVVDRECKPGAFPWERYLEWWRMHAQQFLQHHGEQNLIKYTGHPVVGRVRNLQDLETCLAQPYLELESMTLA